MQSVLVVCGAGASSTFLAHRMRNAAKVRNLELRVSAANIDDLELRLKDTDVVLVGPHLEARFDEIAETVSSRGALARLLPPEIFGSGGEETALNLAVDAEAPHRG